MRPSLAITIFITFSFNYFVVCLCMGIRGQLAGIGSTMWVSGVEFRLSCFGRGLYSSRYPAILPALLLLFLFILFCETGSHFVLQPGFALS